MSEVKVRIGADTAGFSSGMANAEKSLSKLLESEKRVENQLGSLASEMIRAKSGSDILLSSVNRLADTFKTTLGVGVAVQVGVALKDALVDAAKEANELSSKIDKINSTPIGKTSIDTLAQIKDELKTLQALESEYGDMGIIGKALFGKNLKESIDGAYKSVSQKQEFANAQAEKEASEHLKTLDTQIAINEARLTGNNGIARSLELGVKYDKQIADAQRAGNKELEKRLIMLRSQESLLQKDASKKKEENTFSQKEADEMIAREVEKKTTAERIAQDNEILRMRMSGENALADLARARLEIEDRIRKASEEKNDKAISSLQEQLSLTEKMAQVELEKRIQANEESISKTLRGSGGFSGTIASSLQKVGGGGAFAAGGAVKSKMEEDTRRNLEETKKQTEIMKQQLEIMKKSNTDKAKVSLG